MKAALVIMAAGLGSRYGGNKQIEGMGPNGEILLEYSIHDAVRAGFSKVVLIIKPEMRETMNRLMALRSAGKVEIEYAYQDFASVLYRAREPGQALRHRARGALRPPLRP